MRCKQTLREPLCTPSKSQKRASIASRVIRAMNPMQYGKDSAACFLSAPSIRVSWDSNRRGDEGSRTTVSLPESTIDFFKTRAVRLRWHSSDANKFPFDRDNERQVPSCPDTVEKIIKSPIPNEPEKAQIAS